MSVVLIEILAPLVGMVPLIVANELLRRQSDRIANLAQEADERAGDWEARFKALQKHLRGRGLRFAADIVDRPRKGVRLVRTSCACRRCRGALAQAIASDALARLGLAVKDGQHQR